MIDALDSASVQPQGPGGLPGEDRTWSALDAGRAVIHTVFHICSASRWLGGSSRYLWHRSLAARGLEPPYQIAEWLRILQAAHLVNPLPFPRPSCLCPEWFSQPIEQQLRDLLDAWTALPKNRKNRQYRAFLLDKIAFSPDQPLTKTDRKALRGIARFNLWDGEQLTPLGRWIIRREPPEVLPQPAITPWQAAMFTLRAGPQADYALLWEMEAFLQPYAPGQYLLTPPSLRLAAQCGDTALLVSILERGLEHPLDPEMAARILGQPSAHLLPGSVLEFTSPEELAQLRQRPSLRARLETLISSRHVFLPHYRRDDALAALKRQGIPIPPVHSAEPAPGPAAAGSQTAKDSTFTLSEIAELYSLALSARNLDQKFGISEAFLDRLAALLPPRLLQAARKRSLLPEGNPPREWPWSSPDPDGPVPPARVEALQQAAVRSETLVAWYRAAGRPRAERRRLTPLLVEQRGPYLYLLAYCHERRANRIFRLDRLKLEFELVEAPDGGQPP